MPYRKLKKFAGFLWYLVTYLGFLLWCNILTYQAITKWLASIDAVATKTHANLVSLVLNTRLFAEFLTRRLPMANQS